MPFRVWVKYVDLMPDIKVDELEQSAETTKPLAMASFAPASEKPGEVMRQVDRMYEHMFGKKSKKSKKDKEGRMSEEKSRRLERQITRLALIGDSEGKPVPNIKIVRMEEDIE